MESRKPAYARPSQLPVDFLKMVKEVFTANFDAGVKAFEKISKKPCEFKITGAVFPTEVLLSVSLIQQDQLAATTVHASCDFDPKASAPTLEDLLGTCVDAAGSVFSLVLDPASPERLAQLADSSLSAMENVPFEWTEMKAGKLKLFVKIDKSNPVLDQAADDWLRKNDPRLRNQEAEEHAETEKLFVTGPKKPKPGAGTLH